MVPSLERHRDKDIHAGGTADAAANKGEEAAAGEEGEFTILRTRVDVSKGSIYLIHMERIKYTTKRTKAIVR